MSTTTEPPEAADEHRCQRQPPRIIPPGHRERPHLTIAILIVTWNHRHVISRCLRSLESVTRPGGTELSVLVLDNASQDGTAAAIQQYLASRPRSRRERLPMELLQNKGNTGFAGGMNRLLRLALQRGSDYVYLLNPDTVVTADFLVNALGAMSDPTVGIAQSLLLLYRSPDRVNTRGNELHWLGFGSVSGHTERLCSRQAGHSLTRCDIGYASGAAMLVRRDTLQTVGFFDPQLFAYHEDLDLCWRARLAGWRVVLEPSSVIYHDYDFGRYGHQKLYLAERNRLAVVLTNYEPLTLVFLVPALAAAEAAVWAAALRQGWWRWKWRSYLELFGVEGLRWLRRRRRALCRLRQEGDAAIARHFSAGLPTQAAGGSAVHQLAQCSVRAYCRLVGGLLQLTKWRGLERLAAWFRRAQDRVPRAVQRRPTADGGSERKAA